MRWNPQLIWTDILAVHAALLHTGEILFFTGNEFWGWQHETNRYDHVRLFNCQTLDITKVAIPNTVSDLFCCGHAFFGSGNLLLAGGTREMPKEHLDHDHDHWMGERRTWMFDVNTRKLVKCALLNLAPEQTDDPDPSDNELRTGGRWYPTLVTLGSGKILAVGGHPDEEDQRHSANLPEYYEWNTWRYVQGGQDPLVNFVRSENPLQYPRLHLLPDGKIFSSTPFDGNKVMSYALNSGWNEYTTVTPDNPDWREKQGLLDELDGYYQIYNQFNGTSVLLPLVPENDYTPRVMVHGNTNSYLIDLSTSDPRWQMVPDRPLSQRRMNVNSVILPTGEVFFCGGVDGNLYKLTEGDHAGQMAVGYSDDTKVKAGELYDPATGRWQLTPEAQVVRNYHSVALLMPDGRVWIAGSSKDHNYNSADHIELRIEIFEPSYYGLPTRPVIRNVISEHGDVKSGLRGEFTVVTNRNSDITRVAVIRNGSVTHGFNSDQRYVALPFTAHDDGEFTELRVSIPNNPNLMVPGHYMLFLLDSNGVPSEGTFINIRLEWSDWIEGEWDTCVSAPAITSSANNRLDVFAKRATNDGVWHKSGIGGFWTAWKSIGDEPVASRPAAVSRGNNRMDVFVRGMRNELAHKAWDGSRWSDWWDLGGEISSAPSVVSRGANRLDVFARGMHNELAHKSWDGAEWSNWTPLGGEIASAPTAVFQGNTWHIFARGLSDELAYMQWNGVDQSNWGAPLGGPISLAPCAIVSGADRVDVFARGLSNELAHKRGTGLNGSLTWGNNWANLGGVLAQGPAAVSLGPGRIDVVAVSDLGNLLHKYW